VDRLAISVSMNLQNKLLTVSLSFLLGSAAAWSQVTTGTITGTVADSTGAVVPKAKIIIKNQGTGVATDLITNDAGLYKASFLNPGKYTVHLEAAGFKSMDEKDVEVQVGNDALVNLTLQVGSTQDTVVVEGTAPLIESDTSQLSFTVESSKVIELPGLQSGVDRLAFLAPGVVLGFGNINSNGAVFSANGQRARANNFLLDGQDNNDPTIAGPGYFFTNLGAISEFQLITNDFSAEYGRDAGAILNIIVKTGGNQFHGAESFLRRDDNNWTALDNIQRASGFTNPPKYLDTVLSTQVSGPIWKDKWFFNAWFTREWVRSNSASIGTGATLTPDPTGLQQLEAAFPSSITVQNLAKYGAFGNNVGTLMIVPGTTTTKTLTTAAGTPVSIEFASVERFYSQPQDNYDGGFKSDYHLGTRDVFTGKLYKQNNTFANAASNGQAGYLYDNPGQSEQAGGTWVHTFSPTLVNEFRFSYVKTGFFFQGGDTFPFSQLTQNIANVSISGGYLGYGLATNLPQYRLVNSYQYQDNVNKQLGRHALKMGVQYINDHIPLGFLPAVNGQFVFPSFQAYVNNTPNAFNGAAGVATQEPKELDQAYYIQDDFKFRPNLTFNIGLRYEFQGQPINLLNQFTVARESDPATAIWNQSLPLADRTYPKVRTPYLNFSPRLGFAWSPSNRDGFMGRLLGKDDTVIRGGFAIAYDPSFYNLLLNAQTAAPVVYSYTLTTGISEPANIAGSNLQTLYQPPSGSDPRFLNQTRFDPGFRSPYSESFSLGVQRKIGNHMGFEIRGVRTRGVAQFATRNGNPYIAGFINNGFASVVPSGDTPTVSSACSNCNGRVIPGFGNIRIRDNSGQSSYNGLQTTYNVRNLYNQLTLGASYTWSKTMDNVSEAYSFLGSGSILLAQDPFNVASGERGLSNNNVPQAFSLNLVWNLPFFKSSHSWYGRLAGGWNISLFDLWDAGRPMTPVQLTTNANILSDTSFNSFAAGYDTARPFLITSSAPMNSVGEYLSNGTLVNLYNTSQAVQLNQIHWLYNNLAADKAVGTPFGVGRNTLTAPRFQRADLAIYKSFSLTERFKVQIRGEAQNAFNHTVYPTPNLYIEQATFLNITSGENSLGNQSSGAAGPRVIKLGAQVIF
jgi:hypothetical protein